MTLTLIGITNDPKFAAMAESAGINRLMVDMEYIGKEERQKGMDTVKSRHSVEDIKNIRKIVTKAELLVRINPMHQATRRYESTEKEIERVISAGADRIMLPYFKTVEEVEAFLVYVNGRVKNVLLLETAEAVANLERIMQLDGIDEIHIGLNDLSISMNKSFMFEVLSDGTVESITRRLASMHIPFGVGGIAAIGSGSLPAEHIIGEHYRLGSQAVILSRSFFDKIMQVEDEERETLLKDEVMKIRGVEKEWEFHPEKYEENKAAVRKITASIAKK